GKFKALFEKRGVQCYIINTGHFLDKKIPKEVTIGIIESIVDETAEFKPFGKMTDVKTMDMEGFVPDFNNQEYVDLLVKSMSNRINYLDSLMDFKGGRDHLPVEAKAAIQKLIDEER
ncbi:MAG TPA: phosphoenolpyruvate carboxykinase, partial [Anaerovoracaceae bacterium]|nr:phosphoenolpyruvate carboxykinase [Anaerovoracaceae bacterium]